MARPTKYTQDIADTICEKLASGQSLNKMCKAEDMPGMATVFRWLTQFPEFREKYTLAREAQADALFEEVLDIADEKEYVDDVNPETGEVMQVKFDSVAVQRNRLRVDVRKWMAGKLRPKKYGDRMALANDEENPLMPPSITLKRGS
jgi:hypothetical protein